MKNLRLTEEQLAAIQKKGAAWPERKASKFGNEKTRGFDSKKEADRYEELKLLEKAGEISHLRTQVPYLIAVNDVSVCKYVADFVYNDWSRKHGGTPARVEVVEDCKGFRTQVYRLKKKLMLAVHGITIKET